MTTLVSICFCLESTLLICLFWFIATDCNLYLSRVCKIPGVISMETRELNVKCYAALNSFSFFFFPKGKWKECLNSVLGKTIQWLKYGKSSPLFLQRRELLRQHFPWDCMLTMRAPRVWGRWPCRLVPKETPASPMRRVLPHLLPPQLQLPPSPCRTHRRLSCERWKLHRLAPGNFTWAILTGPLDHLQGSSTLRAKNTRAWCNADVQIWAGLRFWFLKVIALRSACNHLQHFLWFLFSCMDFFHNYASCFIQRDARKLVENVVPFSISRYTLLSLIKVTLSIYFIAV